LALCPTVIDEFLHVVTDPKRFGSPLEMGNAVAIAQAWMQSHETTYFLPNEDSDRLHLHWKMR